VADGDVSLRYRLLGEDQASPAFNKAARSSEHLGTKMAAVGRVLGALTAGVAIGGVVGLGAAMVKGVQDAESYQTLQLKTQAVLKSTGNVAGTSVKHIQDLAGSLESLSGVDEELIINSQNVLATFTGIRNQAGKNNDIFDQATKAALNLSTALGTDLQGSSIQVGKALNDPIKGVTALQRVGVSFTESQKDQIKAMVKAGDTMGAQKLILGELNKEFGGAAKAAGAGFGGAMARVQDAVGDAFRAMGQELLPALTEVANWLAAKLPGAMQRLGAVFAQGLGAVHDFIAGVTGVGVRSYDAASAAMKLGFGVTSLVRAFHDGYVTSDGFVGAMERLGIALRNVGDFITQHGTLIGSLATSIGTIVIAIKVWQAVTTALAVVQATLNLVLAANPIGLVVIAIAALVAGLIYAYTHSETFRNVVNSVWATVQGTVLTAVNAVVVAWNALGAALDAVVGWFQALPGRAMSGITSLPGLVLGLIKSMFERAAFLVGFSLGMLFNLFFVWPARVSQALMSLPGIVFHWITTSGVQGVVAFANFHIMLMERAYALTSALVSWVASLIPRVVAWFERLPGMAVAAIKALPGLIKGVFAAAGTWLLDAGKQIVMGLVDGIKSAAGAALSAAKDLGGNIVGGFKAAMGISSPSKVMAEQVGRWIPPGLAMGITQTMPVVYDALSIKAPTMPGNTGTVTAGRGGGSVTNIHVHMQSGFVGSSDQLATAMSDVITRAKARGLNLSFA
jgi:phage-related protein